MLSKHSEITPLHNEKKNLLKHYYNKVIKDESPTLNEITESLYFCRNILTHRGFYSGEIDNLITPVAEVLSYKLKTYHNHDLEGLEKTKNIEILSDFIIIKHIGAVMQIAAAEDDAVDHSLAASTEPDEKGINELARNREDKNSFINLILKELANSLTPAARSGLVAPRITFSRKILITLLSRSDVLDIDRRIYKDFCGAIQGTPLVQIRNYYKSKPFITAPLNTPNFGDNKPQSGDEDEEEDYDEVENTLSETPKPQNPVMTN